MKKLPVLVAATGLMVLALAAAAMPVGQGDDQDRTASPGDRSIEIQGEAVTFGGPLQGPQPQAPH